MGWQPASMPGTANTDSRRPETASHSCRPCMAGASLPVPNETRLQELYALAQRKPSISPGPGAYEVGSTGALGNSGKRRPQHPELYGPVLLGPADTSLRYQDISNNLLLHDSGMSPAAYEGPAGKDACLTKAPTPKIGSAHRFGPTAISPDQLYLSVSRSLGSGLNWKEPVSLGQVHQHIGINCGSAGGSAAGTAAAGASRIQQRSLPSRPANLNTAAHTQHQQQQFTAAPPARQLVAGTSALLRPRSTGSSAPASRRGLTGSMLNHQQLSGLKDSGQCKIGSQPRKGSQTAVGLPWRLTRSLDEWEGIRSAMAETLQQQQQREGQQQQQHTQGQPDITASADWQSSAAAAVIGHGQTPPAPIHATNVTVSAQDTHVGSQQQTEAAVHQAVQLGTSLCPESASTPAGAAGEFVVSEQQHVVQHMSAARAAEAVSALAAKRDRWKQLSS